MIIKILGTHNEKLILNSCFLLHILLLDYFGFSAFIMLFIDKNGIRVILKLEIQLNFTKI